jgi:hypothetical protein
LAVAVAATVAAIPAVIVKLDLLTHDRFSITSKFWVLLHFYGLGGYVVTYVVLYLVVGILGTFVGDGVVYGVVGALLGSLISDAILSGHYVVTEWVTVVTTAAVLAVCAFIGGLVFQKLKGYPNDQ